MGSVMQFVSRLGSPQFAFTLFFPLLFAVHWSVGVRYLWVAIISDWLNMVLKWYEKCANLGWQVANSLYSWQGFDRKD